ncbi:hypothetical protein ALC60_05023 [Trachymyrmex zeteki]|uniref:Uncharacterized protein n=1 Tax=Mycetomoellerius zeteki TaxID=64791 RepID=A0A151X6W2_9HYME|nr:hypothetical protein ALC60_05023 [Trachymyrmex zeteki]
MCLSGEPPLKAVSTNTNAGQSSASSQFICKYHLKDLPPYVVIIQSVSGGDASRINPVAVSRVVSKLVGDNNVVEIKSAGHNKVSVSFKNYEKANSLIDLEALKAHNLKASIPAFRILRSGVIKNVSLDISEDTIQNDFSSTAKIISVRAKSPPLAYLYVRFFSVMPYIPRVLMCFACLRFGHISLIVKVLHVALSVNRHEKNRGHEKIEDCPRHQLPPSCCNCGQEHFPSSNKCPVYARQR